MFFGVVSRFAAEARVREFVFSCAVFSLSSWGQLHHADFAAEPCLWHRQHDEREWIPVRTEGRAFVSGYCGAGDAFKNFLVHVFSGSSASV